MIPDNRKSCSEIRDSSTAEATSRSNSPSGSLLYWLSFRGKCFSGNLQFLNHKADISDSFLTLPSDQQEEGTQTMALGSILATIITLPLDIISIILGVLNSIVGSIDGGITNFLTGILGG